MNGLKMNGLKITLTKKFDTKYSTINVCWNGIVIFQYETIYLENIQKLFYDTTLDINQNIHYTSIQCIGFNNTTHPEHTNEETIKQTIQKIVSFEEYLEPKTLNDIINNVIEHYYSINSQIQPNTKK
jgi:hypothetical protein